MSTNVYPNRDALRDALDIYLNSMSDFIVKSLRQSQKQTREEIIRQHCRKDTLEWKDIAHIINSSWHHFENHFKLVDEYYDARSVVRLIVEGRNRVSHPPWDLDPEFTQTQLFIIAEILSKINRPSEQREVKKIREDLFYDDTKGILAEAEERIGILESEKQEYERSNAELSERIAEKNKRLQDAASEKQEHEEGNAELSRQLIDKDLRIKNLSEKLKETEVEKTNYKKDLTKTREELEKIKTLHINYTERLESLYTERLESLEKEIKDTTAALHAAKKNLTEAGEKFINMEAKDGDELPVAKKSLTEAGEKRISMEAKVGDEDVVSSNTQKHRVSQSSRWSGDKGVREVVRDAVRELTQDYTDVEFTIKEVASTIHKTEPSFKNSTVSAQIIQDCVNHTSRHHHASTKHNYYWRLSKGIYRLYDPYKDK